jgi:hypothetical protein
MPQIRVHKRYNGWGLGDYDVFKFDGMLCVGQLARIADNGWGQFWGYVLNSTNPAKMNMVGQLIEWGKYLHSSTPDQHINPRLIGEYEKVLAQNDQYKQEDN